MNRGFPSMTALLGLLAVAGYQNRDKLAEWLGKLSTSADAAASGPDGQKQQGQQAAQGHDVLGGLLGSLTGGGGAAAAGGGVLGGLLGSLASSGLGNGLNDLVEQFQKNGQGDVANSWVGTGPNKPVAPQQVEQAVGPDMLDTIAQQTGLSRDDLLQRLSQILPQAVDQLTPQGRLPSRGA